MPDVGCRHLPRLGLHITCPPQHCAGHPHPQLHREIEERGQSSDKMKTGGKTEARRLIAVGADAMWLVGLALSFRFREFLDRKLDLRQIKFNYRSDE